MLFFPLELTSKNIMDLPISMIPLRSLKCERVYKLTGELQISVSAKISKELQGFRFVSLLSQVSGFGSVRVLR
ncbi:hypothetical protein Bca4012_017836 [Brassica carinata]